MAEPVAQSRRGLQNPLAPIAGSYRQFTERRDVRFVLLVLLAFVLLVYPVLDKQDGRVDVASAAEVYVLLALGLNIVVGYAGLLDLGYAAFYAIGAYTMAFFASSQVTLNGRGFSSPFLSFGSGGIHVNFFLMIPVAAAVAAFCGVLFGAPTLRLRGDYLAIVTLGFGEIVPKVIQNLGPDNSLGLPNITNGVNRITGIDSPPNVSLASHTVSFQTNDPRPWYYLGLILIAFSIVVIYSLRTSRLGRAWAAIREDEIAAAHMGINIMRTRLLAFGLGAAFSGFAGLMEASRIGSVDYTQFLFGESVTILVMVILGGMGSIPGAIMGAVIIKYLDLSWLALINQNINSIGANLRTSPGPVGALGTWMARLNLVNAKPLIFGLILVGIMVLRPQGLFPSRTRARELAPQTEQIKDEENTSLYGVREE